MVDPIFETLKKNAEKKSGLDCEISFRLSSSELKILSKKADVSLITKEELVREYMLKTAAFDGSVFEEKKTKKKEKEVENE